MKPNLKALWFGGVVLFFSVAACEAATAPAPAVSDEAATVLPKFSVSGDVPLRKIAEHRLLEARWAHAAVVHGDFIYVIAGFAGGAALASVERFDTRTGKSTPFATLRSARALHRAVLVGDKVYVFGGRVTDFIPVDPTMRTGLRRERDNARKGDDTSSPMQVYAGPESRLITSVEVIDLATGTVSSGPAMPEARAAFGCVVLNGKIYVIGGNQQRGPARSFTNRTLVLDLATSKWSTGIPMPYAVESSAVVVDGFIAVVGGYDGRRSYEDVVVFSPEFKGWRALAPLHQAASAHAMIHLGQHLFLFGSYDRPHEIIAYDLKKKSSEAFTLGYDMARHATAVVSGEKIYVVGGKASAESTPDDLVQVFELTKKSTPAK